MELKDVIKEIRLSQGLTMRQIAERAGVTRITWLGWEHGKHRPSDLSLWKIKQVTPDDLKDDLQEALGGDVRRALSREANSG